MKKNHYLKRLVLISLLSFCLFIPCSKKAFATTRDGIRYEVRIIKHPTEDENGIREYIYEDGTSYTEEIPATGHKWSEWIVDVEPTKDKAGHKYRVCTKYPDAPHYEEAIIPPIGKEEVTIASHIDQNEISKAISSREPTKESVETLGSNAESSSLNNETLESKVLESKALVNETSDNSNETLETKKEEVETSVKRVRGFFTEINQIDVISGVLFVGVLVWAYIFVWPLVLVLIWADKKRKELMKK